MNIKDLNDIPTKLRVARMETLKYIGERLRSKGYSKNLRRRVLLELDFKLWLAIEDIKVGEYKPIYPFTNFDEYNVYAR